MRLLLLDTNLLVLLVAASVDPTQPGRHKRLGNYSLRDFRLLYEFVAGYDRLQLTPNVLTETSNLLVNGMTDPLRTVVWKKLRSFIEECAEIVIPSAVAAARPEFLRLGLADAALIEAATGGATLLTDDYDLYDAAARLGHTAVLFSHLKAQM